MFRKLSIVINKWEKYSFLFSQLAIRDFKKKYKRTVLGVFWSVLSPLLSLLVMQIVFTNFFGRNIEHYTTYLFIGNLVFGYFRESTTLGMIALMQNASIINKINIPKYLFVMSSNMTSLLNFALTLVVMFIFVAIDGVMFTWRFFFLLFPIACLLIFNVGMGLILSAMYVFFRDMQYLYNVITMVLMYMSAIFYPVDGYSVFMQRLFLLNPLYVYIKYFRIIILDGNVPSLAFHGLCLLYAAFSFAIGALVYKKNNQRFLYYL